MAARLKVMSYDLSDPAGAFGPFVARFGAIAGLVREANPDVLCLQGVPSPEIVRRLAGYLFHQHKRAMFSACTRIEDPEGGEEYLAIIHPGTRHVARVADDAEGRRLAISLALTGSGLTIVNAHGTEGRDLSPALPALLPSTGPAIVAGGCGDLEGFTPLAGEEAGERPAHLVGRGVAADETGMRTASESGGRAVSNPAAWAILSLPQG